MKHIKSNFALLFVLLLGITLTSACDDENGPSPSEDRNITEITEMNDDFSGFFSIMKGTDVTDYLQGDGPFTVFAPRNDAIQLPNGAGSRIGLKPGTSKDELSDVLKYHVLTSEISSSDLEAEQSVETAAGGELFITKQDGEVRINDTATVTRADIGASNGVIHTINQLLLPDKYQEVAGIISKRYMLQAFEDAAAEAGLIETLKKTGGEEYTVFAPSDSAFSAYAEAKDLALSELTQEELQSLLTYHVLPAKMLSADLTAKQTVETVNGETLDIAFSDDGSVSLTDQAGNTSQVTTSDLKGTNGVVHIIDGVLLPE